MSLSSYYDDEEFVVGDSEPIDGEVRKIKMSLRERPRQIQTRLSLRKQIEDLKCGGNQDNENQRKSRRRHSTVPAVKWNPFEERINKYYREHEYCDCMDDKCPGCFYDCPNCGSPKCGPTCKVHRKFAYDSIEFDGKDGEIKNKHVAKN